MSCPYRNPHRSTRFPAAINWPINFLRVSANSLKIKLFGAPQVLRDGVSLHGKATQRRRLALLALLATAPSRTLSRDRLVGVIWPERDASQARKLLSEALYVIRRELGESVLDTANGDMVQLNASEIHCDLWQFAQAVEDGDLVTAADLSEAPFLDGVFLDEAEEFERWLEGERRRIAHDRQGALLQLAASAERQGAWIDAAQAWQRLLHDEPLSSRFALGAAQALASGAELPAALQVLSSYEDRLRRELDVAPEPEVLELAQRLRAGRAPGERAVPSATPRRIAPSRSSDGAVFMASALERVELPPPQEAAVPTGKRRYGVLFAVLLAGIASGIFWLRAEAPVSSGYDPRRIAVTYLRDASPEGDLGSVADLVTESVIEQLAGSRTFEVIPVSGVRQLRDGPVGLDSVARRFRVGTVVEGSVLRRGENVVVRVRMIDAETGAVVWSSGTERGLYELFALEDDVASELAIGIRQRIGQEVRLTQLQRESNNVRAWQLVARANREREDVSRLKARRESSTFAAAQDGLRRADSLYRQAQIEDPDWVRPPVERIWTVLSAASWVDGPARLDTLERGLALSDSLAPQFATHPEAVEVRSALRWARLKLMPPPLDTAAIGPIAQDLEAVVGADATRARALATLSNLYFMLGEVERASVMGRRALEADAYIEEAISIYRGLVSAALFSNAADSAAAWCSRGRREYPGEWWFHECQLTVMKYDARSGYDPEEAWRIVAKLDSLDPPALAAEAGHRYAPGYRRLLAAAVSARAGDLTRARAVLQEQRTAAATDSSLALDMIPDEITLLLLFGEREEALDRLRWALSRRPLLSRFVASDPILRTFANDIAADNRSANGEGVGTPVPINR